MVYVISLFLYVTLFFANLTVYATDLHDECTTFFERFGKNFSEEDYEKELTSRKAKRFRTYSLQNNPQPSAQYLMDLASDMVNAALSGSEPAFWNASIKLEIEYELFRNVLFSGHARDLSEASLEQQRIRALAIIDRVKRAMRMKALSERMYELLDLPAFVAQYYLFSSTRAIVDQWYFKKQISKKNVLKYSSSIFWQSFEDLDKAISQRDEATVNRMIPFIAAILANSRLANALSRENKVQLGDALDRLMFLYLKQKAVFNSYEPYLYLSAVLTDIYSSWKFSVTRPSESISLDDRTKMHALIEKISSTPNPIGEDAWVLVGAPAINALPANSQEFALRELHRLEQQNNTHHQLWDYRSVLIKHLLVSETIKNNDQVEQSIGRVLNAISLQ